MNDYGPMGPFRRWLLLPNHDPNGGDGQYDGRPDKEPLEPFDPNVWEYSPTKDGVPGQYAASAFESSPTVNQMPPDPQSMATAQAFMNSAPPAPAAGMAPMGMPKGLSIENLLAFAKTPAGRALIEGITQKTKKPAKGK